MQSHGNKVQWKVQITGPNVTIASQKPDMKDQNAFRKDISNCQTNHQVHALLPQTTLFQVNDRFLGHLA